MLLIIYIYILQIVIDLERDSLLERLGSQFANKSRHTPESQGMYVLAHHIVFTLALATAKKRKAGKRNEEIFYEQVGASPLKNGPHLY